MKNTGWRLLVLVVLTSTLLVGCTQSEPATGELSDEERAEIAVEIKQRNQDLLDVWAEKDALDEWMALYVDDGHAAWGEEVQNVLTVSGVTHESLEEMDAAFRGMLVNRSTQVTMTTESVAVLTPNHAIHFGEFVWSGTTDDATTEDYLASSSTHWVMSDGEWKILHYHQSWPSTTPVPAAQ